MKFTPLPRILIWLCGVILHLLLQWVFLSFPTLDLALSLQIGGALPLLRIHGSKVSLVLLKFMLDLGGISICRARKGNVEELHFLLNVFVQIVAILQHQVFLRIFNT